jgi:2-C-methyl-D-erythritol 4-phosphate cytidylyltransferase/2-C-methyl-D-erythritol 2,4-cyclodiphosphate synthase
VYNFVTLFGSGVFLSDVTLVLLAAGSSSRFTLDVKKQWLRIEHKPLWQFVADRFAKTGLFAKIIITASAEDYEFMRLYAPYTFTLGGATRQESLKNALEEVTTPYVLASDIARCCIDDDLLERILARKGESDCIVPYLNVSDTVIYENATIDRERIKLIQTPQLSATQILKEALQTNDPFTDESSAIVAYGGTREFVVGKINAHKITTVYDLQKIPCLTPPSTDTLSGNGLDVHAFDTKGTMYLGGVKIESDFGFLAHSDGDVALHALIDALLGAAGMGDIGTLFPDNDAKYKGIDSKELLAIVVKKIYNFGFVIVNADITIAAQTPKLGHYKAAMRETIAKILHIENARVNVKATTTEKLGFVGRSEGVAVMANVNLKYFDWTKI